MTNEELTSKLRDLETEIAAKTNAFEEVVRQCNKDVAEHSKSVIQLKQRIKSLTQNQLQTVPEEESKGLGDSTVQLAISRADQTKLLQFAQLSTHGLAVDKVKTPFHMVYTNVDCTQPHMLGKGVFGKVRRSNVLFNAYCKYGHTYLYDTIWL